MITYWIRSPGVEAKINMYIYKNKYLCKLCFLDLSFEQFQHARFDIYDLQWEMDGYWYAAMQQWRKLPLDAVADKVLRPFRNI